MNTLNKTIFIFIFALIIIFIVFAFTVKGQIEPPTDADKFGFSVTDDSVSLHYEWEDATNTAQMSASVPANPCNTLGICD